jgi:hypothetical protein
MQGKQAGKDRKSNDSHRWTRGFRTKKETQTELTRILRTLDDGSYVEPAKQLVGEFLDRRLADVRPNLAGKTFERYRQIVESEKSGSGRTHWLTSKGMERTATDLKNLIAPRRTSSQIQFVREGTSISANPRINTAPGAGVIPSKIFVRHPLRFAPQNRRHVDGGLA